jgi:hypothetical protein
MELVGKDEVYITCIQNSTDNFVVDSAYPISLMPQSKFDMDKLRVCLQELGNGLFRYEKDGKVVDENDMISDEIQAHIIQRSAKTAAVKSDVAPSANQVKKPAVQINTDVSSYTCFFNILRDVYIGDKIVPVHLGLKGLIDGAGIETTEELAKVCSYIVNTIGPVKGKLGDLDESLAMTVDDAKDIVANKIKKDRVIVTTPVLLGKLAQYKFEMKVRGEGGIKPLTFEKLKSGYDLDMDITLDGVKLNFKVKDGVVDVIGDVDVFFDMWNAHLKGEEMEYVHITPEEKVFCDTLLATYDLKYSNTAKVWSMSRHTDLTKNAAYADFSPEDWAAISQFNVSITEFMNKEKYPSHYMDQYNLYLHACDVVFEKKSDAFISLINRLTVQTFVASSSHISKANVDYKKIIGGTVPLKDAIKMANDVRNERGKYRNVGPREALTKNMCDPLYPMFPSPFVTARKFMSIVVTNPDLYEGECDVYGCARMRFYGPLSDQHNMVTRKGVPVIPGKRNYFDNNDTFTGNTVGVDVQFGDFYAITTGAGKGKGLIDDVHLPYSKEVKEKVQDCIINYPAGCFSHKIRMLHTGQYKNACLKLIFNKMKAVDTDKELNGGWLYPLSYYKSVKFDVPGKLQSGEFYIYAMDRQDSPDMSRLERLKNQWAIFAQRKCAVMVLAHGIMNAATMSPGKVMMRRNSLFDVRSIKTGLPELLRTGSTQNLILNGLNTFVVDVGVVNKDKLQYYPNLVVGKAYVTDTTQQSRMAMDLATF